MIIIWPIVLFFDLLTGIVCSGFFLCMYLDIGTVVGMGLMVIGFIIDLLARTSKGIRVTGFKFCFFLVATLSSFASMEISENLSTRLADIVIHALYNYKGEKRHFSKEISKLSIKSEIRVAFGKH